MSYRWLKNTKIQNIHVFVSFFFHYDANFVAQSCKLLLKLVESNFIAFRILKLHV